MQALGKHFAVIILDLQSFFQEARKDPSRIKIEDIWMSPAPFLVISIFVYQHWPGDKNHFFIRISFFNLRYSPVWKTASRKALRMAHITKLSKFFLFVRQLSGFTTIELFFFIFLCVTEFLCKRCLTFLQFCWDDTTYLGEEVTESLN